MLMLCNVLGFKHCCLAYIYVSISLSVCTLLVGMCGTISCKLGMMVNITELYILILV